jgi:dTDP-4-dehydrorhamnose reductase
MKRFFITGGSGALGKVLVNHLSKSHTVLAPTSKECNILNLDHLKTTINSFTPDVILHLAAFVDTFGCENDIEKAINTNIIGTINVVKSTPPLCKVIYISSEYVFRGDKGNYTVQDKLNPINVYGKTKASSEYIVSILDNYQIIRVPFIKEVYPKVFTDQYCSRYFLDEVAPQIEFNILHNNNNIIHISPERKSLYQTYIDKGFTPTPIKTPLNYQKLIPRDTSLINNSLKL